MSRRARAWTERAIPRTGGALPSWLKLRQPSGRDELALAGIDTDSATAFLDRLVEPAIATGELAASDRDTLLAMLHRGLWGDRIVSSLTCSACGEMYDLSFALSALQQSLEAAREPSSPGSGVRVIVDREGREYRLPSARAETEAAVVAGAGAYAVLAGAIGDDHDPVTLDARLEVLAPIIDVDLDAPCAECGHAALVRFDIQTFTLQRLLDEREGILAEVHAIASGYGWSLDEILGLDRTMRRAFADRLAGTA